MRVIIRTNGNRIKEYCHVQCTFMNPKHNSITLQYKGIPPYFETQEIKLDNVKHITILN